MDKHELLRLECRTCGEDSYLIVLKPKHLDEGISEHDGHDFQITDYESHLRTPQT